MSPLTSRAKHSLFCRFLIVVVCTFSLSQAQFPDVPPGHWSESAVLRMTELGVIMGFPDGKFRGDDTVTRYQLALMLTRLFDSWNTEQLSEVWSELVGVTTRVDTLESDLFTLQQSLDTIQTQLENGLVDTATFQDVEASFTASLRDLEQNVADLALQIPSISDEDLETVLNDLTLQIEDVRAGLLAVEEKQNVAPTSSGGGVDTKNLETNLQTLSTRLDGLEQALTALQNQSEQTQTPAVVADLSLSSGFLGRDWQGTFGVALETSYGRLDALVNESGFEGRAKGYVIPALALQGRLTTSTGLGMVGLETSLGGLDIGLLGGVDEGLAGTLYIVHNGSEATAVIPGLNLFGAASLGEGETASRFMVRLHAAYRFSGDIFYLQPGVAYETNNSLGGYSYLAPELGAGIRFGDSALLALAAQYVFANSSVSGQAQAYNVFQGELELSFDSGAFLIITADGGIPEFTTLPSFETEAPAQQDVQLGATVGYSYRIR
ncbi:MAG: S-layer homology domain-containing protein [Trueperaceae bacterium]